MPNTHLSVDDYLGTLNGFEEEAIEKRYGQTVDQLVAGGALKLMRAMIFIDHTRQGARPDDAYMAAQKLTIVETQAFFPDETEAGGGSEVQPPATETAAVPSHLSPTTENPPLGQVS